jgi:AcrR family transcriptional regulator
MPARRPGAAARSAARPDAREAMILVAERLFAERGIGDVSLREIGAAAGQRNNGAAQYHFGSKRGLVDAIIEHRMQPINEQRLALLGEIDTAGRGAELRALVEVLVLPFAGFVAEHGTYWARFLAQASTEPDADPRVAIGRPEMQGFHEVTRRLERALRALPPAVRRDRLELAFTLLVHAGSRWERTAAERARGRMATALLAANLVDAIVGVLAAPVSDETRRTLRRKR